MNYNLVSNFNNSNTYEIKEILKEKRKLPNPVDIEIIQSEENLRRKKIKLSENSKKIERENSKEYLGCNDSSLLSQPLEKEFLETENIVFFDSKEWTTLLKPAPQLEFAKRIELLKSQLTEVKNIKEEGQNPWWEAWLEIVPSSEKNPLGKSIQIIMVEEAYDSNTFPEKEIHEFSPKKNEGMEEQKYLFIKIFQESDSERETPVYVYRIDLEGALAEVLHIQAVEGIVSGSEMLKIVHQPFDNYFQPTLSLLHDDAKVEATLSKKKKVQFNLRRLRGGASWYEAIGYMPLECANKTFISKKCMTQSVCHYYAAAEKMKTVTIGYLKQNILREDKSAQKHLNQLMIDYLKGSKNKKESDQTTLMELISKISIVGRQDEKLKKRIQANKDLSYVYEELLTPFEMDSSHSLEEKMYNLALSIIQETRIFCKNSSSKEDLSFGSFMQKPHVKFDELVREKINKDANANALWDDFIS